MFYTLLNQNEHSVLEEFETLFDAMCNYYDELNDSINTLGFESIEFGFLDSNDEMNELQFTSI
tara:strand:- start:260 stop:448 length:189 start_codon:yes stop_codon:yes gene_type:complete